MYLVHQIIVHILYAILCSNQRHMDEERMDTRHLPRQHTNHCTSVGLAPALYHDEVISKVRLDKR